MLVVSIKFTAVYHKSYLNVFYRLGPAVIAASGNTYNKKKQAVR